MKYTFILALMLTSLSISANDAIEEAAKNQVVDFTAQFSHYPLAYIKSWPAMKKELPKYASAEVVNDLVNDQSEKNKERSIILSQYFMTEANLNYQLKKFKMPVMYVTLDHQENDEESRFIIARAEDSNVNFDVSCKTVVEKKMFGRKTESFKCLISKVLFK